MAQTQERSSRVQALIQSWGPGKPDAVNVVTYRLDSYKESDLMRAANDDAVWGIGVMGLGDYIWRGNYGEQWDYYRQYGTLYVTKQAAGG